MSQFTHFLDFYVSKCLEHPYTKWNVWSQAKKNEADFPDLLTGLAKALEIRMKALQGSASSVTTTGQETKP